MPIMGGSTTVNQNFNIPVGVYTAGYWLVTTSSVPQAFQISTDSGLHIVNGTPTQTINYVNLSAAQIADVNAAAGGILPATYYDPDDILTVVSWTLQLTAVGLIVNTANFPWTKLGVTVSAGQGITFSVSGSVTQTTAPMGGGYYAYPEGAYSGDTTGGHADQPGSAITSFPSSSVNWPAPNCRPWSIVFSTGTSMPAETGVAALQGDRMVSFSSAQVGGQTLWATFNDDTSELPNGGYFDNVGSLTLSVVVTGWPYTSTSPVVCLPGVGVQSL